MPEYKKLKLFKNSKTKFQSEILLKKMQFYEFLNLFFIDFTITKQFEKLLNFVCAFLAIAMQILA